MLGAIAMKILAEIFPSAQRIALIGMINNKQAVPIQPKRRLTFARLSSEFLVLCMTSQFNQFQFSAGRTNGLRHRPRRGYPRVGGRRQRCFDGTHFKPRKLPGNAQTPTRRVHAVLGSFFTTGFPLLFAYDNCLNTSGFCSAILNKATAGPLGLRLPCSQSWTVRKLTPIKPANADCDNFNLVRITFGGEGSFSE